MTRTSEKRVRFALPKGSSLRRRTVSVMEVLNSCALNMSETTTTTEVLEQRSTTNLFSPKSLQRWSFSNLQGFLPFLPKVPLPKETSSLLQQLSPSVIKSECVITRRLAAASSKVPSFPSAIPAAPTRVQTIGSPLAAPALSTQEDVSEKKRSVKSFTFSIADFSLLNSISNFCPAFLRIPQLQWWDKFLLTGLAVYSGLFVLVVESFACLLGLIAGSMPPGLVFMVSALLLMMTVACMTIGHDPNVPDHALLSSALTQRNPHKDR